MGFLLTPRAAAAAGIFAVALAANPLTNALDAQAVIRGVLYDDGTGAPIRGTVMLVDPATDAPVVRSIADSLGRFELSAGGGTYQLAAVRDGYASVLSAPIPLVSGERITVRFPIAHQGDPQHRIGVTEHIKPDRSAQFASAALAKGFGMAGFESRRTTGTGLHYDRAALESSNVATLGEFLQNVPGLRVLNPGSTSSMAMTRSAQLATLAASTPAACHVGWFIDGHRMDLPGQVDAITDGLGQMQLETIEAIEIFRGVSEMPPEFAEPDLRCGAVAIWTRRQ